MLAKVFTPFKSRLLGLCLFVAGLLFIAVNIDFSSPSQIIIAVLGGILLISGIVLVYTLGRCPKCNMVNPIHFGKHCVHCGADMDKK